MERQLKERLIGAAVLMAAAIVLIPEMLSGPPRASRETDPVQVASDPGLKAFTIDLTRPPGSTIDPPAAEEAPARAEPRSAAVPPDEARPESPDGALQSSGGEVAPTTRSAPQSRPEPAPARTQQSSSPPPAQRPAPQSTPPQGTRPQSTAPRGTTPTAVPTGSGWAVQLGSFASRETAERMVADLRAKNHSSFVMPVKAGGRTLYRVRIGPMSERSAAEAELRKVRGMASGAAVVAHP